MYKMRHNFMRTLFSLVRRQTQIGVIQFGFAVAIGFVCLGLHFDTDHKDKGGNK